MWLGTRIRRLYINNIEGYGVFAAVILFCTIMYTCTYVQYGKTEGSKTAAGCWRQCMQIETGYQYASCESEKVQNSQAYPVHRRS